jgi:hypothetical protein
MRYFVVLLGLAAASPAQATHYGHAARVRSYAVVTPFVQLTPVVGVPAYVAPALVAPAYVPAVAPAALAAAPAACATSQLLALPNYSLAAGIPYGVGTAYPTFTAFVNAFPVYQRVVVRRFFTDAFVHGITFRQFVRGAVVVRGGRFLVRPGVRVVARGGRAVVRVGARAAGVKRRAARRGARRAGRRAGRRAVRGRR